MRQYQAIWLIIEVREADIRLNKESKTHDNAIITCIKFKRSAMRLFFKDMVVLYKGLPHPKEEMSAWAPNAIHDLTRVPMYGKSLPFT